VKEINTGLEQLGISIQNNSATSEETAAASEEMSAQAVELDSLIGFFKTERSGRTGRLGGGQIVRSEKPTYTKQRRTMIELPEPSDNQVLNYGDGPIEY